MSRRSTLRFRAALLAGLCLAGGASAGTAQAADGDSAGPSVQQGLDAASINDATLRPEAAAGTNARPAISDGDRPDALTIRAQVLLDRARFYPGAIDGRDGDNFERALSAYAVAQGLPAGKRLTPDVWDKLKATSDRPAVKEYTITQADVAGPYVGTIPPKMEAQADLKAMDYTNPREMLAERFHMSRDLLSAINPDKPLDKAGTVILVAAVDPMGTEKLTGDQLHRDPLVERIDVDKRSRDVRAYGKDGKLLGYFPASIGSTEKPAPSGNTRVKGVAFDPVYTYNPKYAFKGVKTKTKFTIKPGPNNPVGLVWIDLAIPSYGIHGTPEPEKVGKTESHGCIRLTNWNARELAAHVAPGAKVAFKND